MSLTSQGYGQDGFGDGKIMRTTFEANWPEKSDGRWFQIKEDELNDKYLAQCTRALKYQGYLDITGKPIRSYVHDKEYNLPLVCEGETGRLLSKIVAQRQTPRHYGHYYAYGNHQELVKAKLFTEDTEDLIKPLHQDSFAKHISGLNVQQSRAIWRLLVEADYITTDQQRYDTATAVGKPGKPLLRREDIMKDLRDLDVDYVLYLKPIEDVIKKSISMQTTVSLEDFEKVFLDWEGVDLTSSRLIYNTKKRMANQISQMLINKNYLTSD